MRPEVWPQGKSQKTCPESLGRKAVCVQSLWQELLSDELTKGAHASAWNCQTLHVRDMWQDLCVQLRPKKSHVDTCGS